MPKLLGHGYGHQRNSGYEGERKYREKGIKERDLKRKGERCERKREVEREKK